MATQKDYMEQIAKLPDEAAMEKAITVGGISEMYANQIREMWRQNRENVFYEEDHYDEDPVYNTESAVAEHNDVDEEEEKQAIRKVISNFPYLK